MERKESKMFLRAVTKEWPCDSKVIDEFKPEVKKFRKEEGFFGKLLVNALKKER